MRLVTKYGEPCFRLASLTTLNQLLMAATSSSAKMSNQSADNNYELLQNLIAESDNKFTIQPNPVTRLAQINFEVKVQGRVSIGIYNYMGQEVAVLFNGIAESWKHYQITFDTQHLSEGIYFGILSTDSERTVVKIAVVK